MNANLIAAGSGGQNSIGGASDTGNITFNANSWSFSTPTTIQTSGTVTFAPYTASTAVNVATGSTGLQVASSILSNVTAGNIVIGNSSDTGEVTLGAESWNALVSFISGTSGSITVSSSQTGTGNASLSFTGPTTLDANLVTANQAINLNNAVNLGANVILNAGTGTLTFGSTVNGNDNLTASAATFSLLRPGGHDATWRGCAYFQQWPEPAFHHRRLHRSADHRNHIRYYARKWNDPYRLWTGTSITLASGRNFINSAGSSALTSSNGRSLVYSTNPTSDLDGGLSNSFRRFSRTYGGSCPSFPTTGNGFLYTYKPLLTATPNGGLTATYGNAAPT